MGSRENKQLMQHVLSELERGNFQPFADCMSDGIVWTVMGQTPWSRSYAGKSVVFDELLDPLRRRIDGRYRLRPTRLIADDDVVVVEGTGDNRLRDGRRYDNTYCLVCRFRDGQLCELTEYMDTDLVMRLFGDRRASVG